MGACNPWYWNYPFGVQTIESSHQRIKIGRWTYINLLCCSCGIGKNIRMDVVRLLDKRSVKWKCNKCTSSTNAVILSTKHGKYGSPSYSSWRKMKDRCLNKNHKYSKYYLEKGITICEKWMSFDGFYEDMGDRPPGYSLDRIDNNLGYFKENCRWIPLHDQPKNRSCCKKPYIPPLSDGISLLTGAPFLSHHHGG